MFIYLIWLEKDDWDTKFTPQMTTKTCNVQGTGSARYVASGSVWFNYEDKVFTNSILPAFESRLTVSISELLKVTRMGTNIINVGFIYYELKGNSNFSYRCCWHCECAHEHRWSVFLHDVFWGYANIKQDKFQCQVFLGISARLVIRYTIVEGL